MGKIVEISEDLSKLVNNVVLTKTSLKSMGLDVRILGLTKSKDVAKVAKATDVIEWFAEGDNMILLYLYEPAFDKVDDVNKELWAEMALARVSYNLDKDKVELTSELDALFGMHSKYGDLALRTAQLQVLTIQQLIDEEKQRKDEAKALKIKKNKK